MPTDKQAHGPSDRVVSVRLPEDLIQRLDRLSRRTHRSRGVYLRLMIGAMLPVVEEQHHRQQLGDAETEARFRALVQRLSSED